MAKVNLTPDRIRQFMTDKAQAFLWDTDTKGLAVRATASGTKAFIFQSVYAGNDVRITIGDVNTYLLDAARAKANAFKHQINNGLDPRSEKRKNIEAEKKERAELKAQEELLKQKQATVQDAWSEYLVARQKNWGDTHYKDHVRLARSGGELKAGGARTNAGPLAPLMGIKLADLTPEHIEEWLSTEKKLRPTQTALAFRLLRAFIGWCKENTTYQTVVRVEAVGNSSVRENVPKSKAKLQDCLQREQLAAWFKAVRELSSPVQSAYLQGLLLTGARRRELSGLKWEDVDFQWKHMTIRDKVEGERIIPLTPYIAQLLANLPKRNEFVFSSPSSADKYLQSPTSAHARALKIAGLPHVTLHGLRRSFSTLSEWTETPMGIVSQIMGHKPSAIVEKHYKSRPLDLLRMWHAKLEAWMLEQAGIEQPKEVVAGLRLVK